jgi:large subunit ribosomal protein L5
VAEAVKKTAKAAKPAESKPEKAAKPAESKAPGIAAAPRLKTMYGKEVVPYLQKHFSYKNVNEVPRLEKIILNMGLGDIKDNSKSIQLASEELRAIVGQKPVLTQAKKSVANFKVRQGMNVGAKVTLRGAKMYEFLDKLTSVALPRVRDFRGVPAKSFDGRGNFSMGVREQLIFPEIAYDQIEKIRGFDICIVTTAKTDEEAHELLKALGMPFAKAN